LESGFRPPFSWLIKSARGHWTFDEAGKDTKIVWNFSFVLTNPLCALMAMPIAKIFFQEAQARCLQNIKTACEK
jgi:hypothetical protein